MIQYFCDVLGVTFNSLDSSQQLVILIVCSVLCLIIFDCILRFITSPIFALMGRFTNKR